MGDYVDENGVGRNFTPDQLDRLADRLDAQKKKPIPLTISALTRANFCAASVAQSVGTPAIEGEAAAFGTAVHAALEEMMLDEGPPDLQAVARRYAVDPIALAEHVDNVEQFAHGSPEVRVELAVTGLGPFISRDGRITDGVTGTVDLIVLGNDGRAEVVDYKTGHPPQHAGDRPIDHWAQGIAYGLAIMQRDPFMESVTVRRYWTRENLDESIVIDGSNKGDFEAWIYNLIRRVVESFDKPVYRPIPTFDGCLGCDGMATCPAMRAKTERAFALAGEFALDSLVDSPERAVEAWESVEGATAIKRGADELKKNVLTPYLERCGPVEMSETTELRMCDHPSGSTYPGVRRIRKKENQ